MLLKIFIVHNFQHLVNDNVKRKIGQIYKQAIEYLDTERDRDTIICLLTKVTSVRLRLRLLFYAVSATMAI